MSTCNYIYNKTVDKIENGHKINFMTLRNELVTEKTRLTNPEYSDISTRLKELKKSGNEESEEYINLKLYQNRLTTTINTNIKKWELETPKEIRANAVDDVVKAYETGFSQLQSGLISYFNMSFRKKHSSNGKSILLQKNQLKFQNGNLVIPGLGKNDSVVNIRSRTLKKYGNLEISNSVRLMKESNHYYIFVNEIVDINNDIDKNGNTLSYCGIDPGVRTLMTSFSNGEIMEYNQDSEKMKKLNKKLDLLKRGNPCPRQQHVRKGFRKKKYRVIERRKENVVNELHWKIINDLLKRYNVLFLGDIKSHNIVKNGKNPTLNRAINDLKFYKFKTRLLYKAETLGKYVFAIPEHYTSKGCSFCGKLQNIGSKKVYHCEKCNHTFDRDQNAAKNILMKGIIRYNL